MTQLTNETQVTMTADDIKQALYTRYNDPMKYIAMAEFRPGTGYGINSERYIDFYVLDCHKCQSISFEIKVSRSDFLSEMKKPEKRRLALHFSNEFYFVAPKGIIKPDELPAECGLIDAIEFNGVVLRQSRAALHRDTARPTWRLVAAISRSLQKSQRECYEADRKIMSENQVKLIMGLRSAYHDIHALQEAIKRENIEFTNPPYVSGKEVDIYNEIRSLPTV